MGARTSKECLTGGDLKRVLKSIGSFCHGKKREEENLGKGCLGRGWGGMEIPFSGNGTGEVQNILLKSAKKEIGRKTS